MQPPTTTQEQLLSLPNRVIYNLTLVLEHFLGKRISGFINAPLKNKVNRSLSKYFDGVNSDNVRPIDRIEKLSAQEFKENYLQKGIPVIFNGAANNWTSTQNWNLESFATKYGNHDTVHFNTRESDKLELEYQEEKLGSALNKILENEDVNIRFNPLLYQEPELLDDINIEWFNNYMPKSPKMLQHQLYFSGLGSSTHLHCELSNNFYYVIQGKKKWEMYHTRYNPILVPCIDGCPYFYSELDHENPNHEKYPNFKKTIKLEGELKPGDILYIPPFYWHFVTSCVPSISMSVRWTCIWQALKISPTLGFLTLFATKPPFWVSMKHLDDFTAIVLDRRNKNILKKEN